MKQQLKNRKFPWKTLTGILLLAIFFTACKKDNIDHPATPVSGLMAFNLAPDQSAVGFTVAGGFVGTNALAFNNFTGAYLPVNTGSSEVKAMDTYTNTTLATATVDFRDSAYYSAFLIGMNGHYQTKVVNDQLQTLTAIPGKAWVRYINAVPDSTSTPVIAAGGDAPIATAFGTITSFAAVNAGDLNASISNGGNIQANRIITVEENKTYTLLFIGIPGSLDPSTKVQVKFITNGTVTP